MSRLHFWEGIKCFHIMRHRIRHTRSILFVPARILPKHLIEGAKKTNTESIGKMNHVTNQPPFLKYVALARQTDQPHRHSQTLKHNRYHYEDELHRVREIINEKSVNFNHYTPVHLNKLCNQVGITGQCFPFK